MVWKAKDAERLRLHGACRQAGFIQMCQGEDPRTGIRLMMRDFGGAAADLLLRAGVGAEGCFRSRVWWAEIDGSRRGGRKRSRKPCVKSRRWRRRGSGRAEEPALLAKHSVIINWT